MPPEARFGRPKKQERAGMFRAIVLRQGVKTAQHGQAVSGGKVFDARESVPSHRETMPIHSAAGNAKHDISRAFLMLSWLHARFG
jgi:hypothetical protein